MIPSINNPNKDAPFSPILNQEYPENDNEIKKIFDDFIAEYSLPETPKRKYDFDLNAEQEFLNPSKTLKTPDEEEFSLDIIGINPDLLPHFNIPLSEIVPQPNSDQLNIVSSTNITAPSENLSSAPSFANFVDTPDASLNCSDLLTDLAPTLYSRNIVSDTPCRMLFNKLYASPLLSISQRYYLISFVLEKIIIKLKTLENKKTLHTRLILSKGDLEELLPNNFLFHIDSKGNLTCPNLEKNKFSIKFSSLASEFIDGKRLACSNTKRYCFFVFRMIIQELFGHKDLIQFKATEVFKRFEVELSDESLKKKNWHINFIQAFAHLQNALKALYMNP